MVSKLNTIALTLLLSGLILSNLNPFRTSKAANKPSSDASIELENYGASTPFESALLDKDETLGYSTVAVYNKTDNRLCSGLVLRKRLIITAAYCVDSRVIDSDIEVRFGLNAKKGYKTTPVEMIYISQNYSGREDLGEKSADSDNIALAMIILKNALPDPYLEPYFPKELFPLDPGFPLLLVGHGGDATCGVAIQGPLRRNKIKLSFTMVTDPKKNTELPVSIIDWGICEADLGAPIYAQSLSGRYVLSGIVVAKSELDHTAAIIDNLYTVAKFFNEFMSNIDPNLKSEVNK